MDAGAAVKLGELGRAVRVESSLWDALDAMVLENEA
jgi:hypothetical protein